MTRHVLNLSSLPWQIGRVPRQPWGPGCADDRDQVKEWLPATVPGDVRAALIAAGRIPAVESPEGIAAGQWVDDYDWWYRTRLPVDSAPGPIVMLEADGIDYYSAMWLDRHAVATHAGMFGRQVVSLAPYATQSGSHELAIRVWGGSIFSKAARRAPWHRLIDPLLHANNHHLAERRSTTKAQFSFGWDFAPRLLSTGIWDGIRVVMARGAYLEDFWARGEPLAEGEDPGPVRWHLRLRVRRWETRPILAEISIAPENFGGGYQTLAHELEICSEPVSLPCIDDYNLSLEMPFARRWWPWDQGEPCLYRVTVRLRDGNGQMDEISQLAAAVSVRREALPDGAPWRFVLNDRPLFLRGANWTPADVLPGRVVAGDYERLLGQARSAGVNFLRVWGGGLREKAAFWDACDRLGIMAWQEFPLACDFMGQYSQGGAYLNTLAAEAADTVRALRNHPSLIAWCGGNEIDAGRELVPLRLLARTVKQHDNGRPWIPASPSGGDVHQWDTWHGLKPWTLLADTRAPFMSEFGLQALPDGDSLAEMFGGNPPHSWSDPRWKQRKAQVDKLLHYAGVPGLDPAQGVIATQRVQACALQVGVEACRLRRDECGGVAIWQLNEPWPAVSWAVIDHAGRPKAAYRRLARSMQPVLVAARFPWRRYGPGDVFCAEVWLVNDRPDGVADCRVEAEIDKQIVWQADGIHLGPASVVCAGDLAWELAHAPERLTLRLLGTGPDGDTFELAANSYDLSIPFPQAQPVQARARRWLAGLLRETG